MFENKISWFVVLEGDGPEDWGGSQKIYRSEKRARAHFAKSSFPWARIDKWAGRFLDGSYDGDYVDTLDEKGSPQ